MKKVLVIEDNQDICKILKKRLEKIGFSVDVASGGYALLGYIRNAQEPEIIILDLILPERSGVELLCSLKSKWSNAKVFIFSGHAEYKDRQILQEYACEFFLKSEGMSKLMNKLKKEL